MVSIKFTYLYLNNTLEVVIINPWLQLVVVFYMVAKSLEKYLQCFHVSRVYFFAFLHQIFILEVFIIKKMQPTSPIFLNFEHFLLPTSEIIWLHFFLLPTHRRCISVGSKLLPTMSVEKAILSSLANLIGRNRHTNETGAGV